MIPSRTDRIVRLIGFRYGPPFARNRSDEKRELSISQRLIIEYIKRRIRILAEFIVWHGLTAQGISRRSAMKICLDISSAIGLTGGPPLSHMELKKR
jgi:hypothetical protein